MPNTNFVPNWTFERTLPSPFDSYSGKSAVMKDIASKYCNQPKKRATLHSATLQAVFSYMNLENPPAGKAEEELGAIGSQANNFTIAEYPSRTGLLHVVVYNRMTGKFIAGKYEKPLDLDSKPEPYQFKKDEDSGSALYFALMPTFLSDDEFNEKYQELKQHRDDGFPDLPKAAETAAVLCDNVYRRIRYGDSLPIGNIKVDTPANGVLQRLTPLNIQKGVYAPTEIIQGTFQVLKGGHHYTASAVSIPKEDFVDKYILSNSRTLTPQEESTVPILEDWYVIPKEIQRICEHAKLTTDSKQPMRNFMLRGPAGTGKTEGAKAIAAGLHLAILVGDMRLHGKFYSMQHDLMRMGDFESFLVKGQFNCVSDNRTYKKPFIPIVTEYALLLKKTDSFIIPFSIRQEGVFSVQNTDILALTWHHLIRMTMESIGGRVALKDLYALLKEHPKAKKNPHYQERIRATLYEHPDEYIPVSKGYFRLSYPVT